ncbi:2-iminoacetate synthase ThiH [Pelagicoccus sp. NFK12]|uniref:2-iminoacetate synthase ThiH n=1 Tax=Pelagicoccus enzymogenes TaxID=2773457 RepID=A0A927IFR0_9BACT|nr:2-iminoacetate synthase ThiH [Pelagicoccus enzymogenes]MBD5780372.1 2-iminoacetate synthase ThiH [Pelagicoccus enzymogenes]MDQ8197725.1 2-iminoacetate synthase ThiH [Pelagicoccus enzymogenes]
MPTFSEKYKTLDLDRPLDIAATASIASVERILQQGRARSLEEFAALLSPAAEGYLEPLCHLSQKITQKHFGKTMRMFAPLYLSNECVNVCKYCGFSRHNDIPRITLELETVEAEARILHKQGFRSILLVAGEHPKYVSNGYVEECVRRLSKFFPSIALELGPLESERYQPLVAAGCEALLVYQETYHEETYRSLHTAGPKKHFHWRMDTPERAYAAGFRRLGIGALFGLHDWHREALALASHAEHLLQVCWKAQLNVSMPRMRPAKGEFEQVEFLKDHHFVQLITALRLFLPHAGITLSTREPATLRDGLAPIGITTMSAGSSTEPGGYSSFDESTFQQTREQEGEQFHIADERSPKEVAAVLARLGYEPVWKDFDQSLVRA